MTRVSLLTCESEPEPEPGVWSVMFVTEYDTCHHVHTLTVVSTISGITWVGITGHNGTQCISCPHHTVATVAASNMIHSGYKGLFIHRYTQEIISTLIIWTLIRVICKFS